MFLDFHSSKQGLPLVDNQPKPCDQEFVGHMALTKIKMYPDCDTISNVPCLGYTTARDQSMVESGVT